MAACAPNHLRLNIEHWNSEAEHILFKSDQESLKQSSIIDSRIETYRQFPPVTQSRK